MKNILFIVCILCLLTSCSVFRKRNKNGCPTNGKNIGAERILSGETKAIDAAKKAKKFKFDN
jgi:hypothetical protein